MGETSFSLLYIQNANLPTEWAHGYQIMKTGEALTRAGQRLTLLLPRRKNPDRRQGLFSFYAMKPSFQVEWLPVIDVVPLVPFWLEKIPYVLERWTFLRSIKRFLSRAATLPDFFYTRDVKIAEELFRFVPSAHVVLELHDEPRTSVRRWQKIKDLIEGYVVISEGLKNLLREEGIPEERICIAPDGYEDTEFVTLPSRVEARKRLGLPLDQCLIVYAGQLLPWKGVDGLAHVFHKLPDSCQLIFVGGQPEDIERIKKQITFPAEHVRFIGQVKHAEIPLWLSAADAGFLPTSGKYPIGRYFTSPLKLFEYLAAGLPILASNLPSAKEILDESCALFFEADSGENFLTTLQRFCSLTEKERGDMRLRAHHKANRYSWGERGLTISTFLDQLFSFRGLVDSNLLRAQKKAGG